MGIPGSLTLYIFITYQRLTAAISCLCIWPDLTKTPNVISKTILSVHFIAKTVLCGYRSQMRVKVLVAQSCLTLGDSVGCSPPGSSVHGIPQARILEWVAMPFSRGSSQPKDPAQVSCLLHWQMGSLPLVPPGKSKRTGRLVVSVFGDFARLWDICM